MLDSLLTEHSDTNMEYSFDRVYKFIGKDNILGPTPQLSLSINSVKSSC